MREGQGKGFLLDALKEAGFAECPIVPLHCHLVVGNNKCVLWQLRVGQDKGLLLEALKESNCWLEFKVKWKDWADAKHPDGTTWEHFHDLNCDVLLHQFLQRIRREKVVPLPGAPAFPPVRTQDKH